MSDRGSPKQRSTKIETVTNAIKDQIVGGELPPGSRLPIRHELESIYDISSFSLHGVFEKLRSEGFVYGRGRNGTFVADHPPHLNHFAIAIPREIADRFERSIRLVGDAYVVNHPGTRFKIYPVEQNLNDDESKRLIEDIANRRLAGVIFVRKTERFFAEYLQEYSEMPWVSLFYRSELPGGMAVVLDYVAFTERALGDLASRGCRRVAMMRTSDFDIEPGDFVELAARSRLDARSYWHVTVGANCSACARSVTHLLMCDNQKERPDGLVVTDREMVDDVNTGLSAAGIDANGDIALVCRSMTSLPAKSPYAIRRLIFDDYRTLEAAVDLIVCRRLGKDCASVMTMTPHFEEELPAERLAISTKT
jgi:DNA-binding GntR family transcriptional regulator